MALLAGENYLHGIANNNINTIIKNHLKGSLCLVFMENLDFKYQPNINDDYVIPYDTRRYL